MFMQGDLHELHVYCGWTILIFSLSHIAFHLVRWADQGNLVHLLFRHFSGITGLIISLSLLLICIPMIFFKERIRYEIRKNLHYMFIVFAFALCFHTPVSAIPNGGFTAWVFGTILIWYFLDNLYCTFIMTEKIETTKFDVLSSGVQMTMSVSEAFQKKGAQGGYCYVCFPWIDKTQWHAFSLFENPVNPAERQIFVQKAGDWTSKVHSVLQRDTVRPVWVQGPFPSPYANAEAYDNQILVASGIGITPALSVIRAHKGSRRINLIWALRDRDLLHFFLQHLYLDHGGWNLIFYTGKEQLNEEHIDIFTNTNVCIIQGRPNLGQLIPNIIFGIESGRGLPERYVPNEKLVASEMLADLLEGSFTAEHLQDISNAAAEHGFAINMEIPNICGGPTSLDNNPSKRLRQSRIIMEHLSLGFKPWEFYPEARPYLKTLCRNTVIPTWGILYCGGAKILENDLKKVAEEFRLHVHIESFGW
jgi:ferric-chelate reductase